MKITTVFLSAASIDSMRTDPPGWMIALIPALAISSHYLQMGRRHLKDEQPIKTVFIWSIAIRTDVTSWFDLGQDGVVIGHDG